VKMLNVSYGPHTITTRCHIAHTPCCPAYLQFNKLFVLETVVWLVANLAG